MTVARLSYTGPSLLDLPDALLHSIALSLTDGTSFRATCRRGRAAANWAVTRITVRKDGAGNLDVMFAMLDRSLDGVALCCGAGQDVRVQPASYEPAHTWMFFVMLAMRLKVLRGL